MMPWMLKVFEYEGWKKYSLAFIALAGVLYKLDGMDLVWGVTAVLAPFGAADVGAKFAANKPEVPNVR